MTLVNGCSATTQQAPQVSDAEVAMDRNYLLALADLDPDLPGIVFGIWDVAP